MSGEFAGTLRERVIIERPVAARTESGLQRSAWETVASCLAAIVPDGAGAAAQAMAAGFAPRFVVTIRVRDDVAVGQRLRWGARLLTVRLVTGDPRRRERTMLRCEEVRG